MIANSKDIKVLHRILDGQNIGTLFVGNRETYFDLPEFVEHMNES